MEAITEQYKTMSAENGVFGILFPTYVKHDFQVGKLFSAIIVTFMRLIPGTFVKPPAL